MLCKVYLVIFVKTIKLLNMKKLTLLFVCLAAMLTSCSGGDDVIEDSQLYSVLIVDVTFQSKSAGCIFQLYDANNVSYDVKSQKLTNLYEGNALGQDGKAYKNKYMFSESDGRLSERVDAGKYMLIVIHSETGKYSGKMVTVLDKKTTELKKDFQSDLPRYSFEEW